MDRNLESYLQIYDNWIPDNICDEIIESLVESKWKEHTYFNPDTLKYVNVSGSAEFDVSYDVNKFTPYVNSKLEQAFQKYVYDLQFPWFGSFNGFSSIRYNRYSENDLMNEHCDHIKSLFPNGNCGIPILSCLFVLNDNYKGGEFIMWKDTTIELRKGDAVLFPSNFLYPHKVLPVTEGTRYTCVSWFY